MLGSHSFRLNLKSRQLNNVMNHDIEYDLSNERGEMAVNYMTVRLTLRDNWLKFKISRKLASI